MSLLHLPAPTPPPWAHDIPDEMDLPLLVEPAPIADPALASVVDVFGRCEWCRRPTPGVLADCADPACPGSAS